MQAFSLHDDPFYREFLIDSCMTLLHSSQTQEFGDLAVFLGMELIKMLEHALEDAANGKHWNQKIFSSLMQAIMVMSLERGILKNE